MKIYRNQENLISAWQIAVNSLDNIKLTLLDNRENKEEIIEAFYKIMNATNEWYYEIKRLPF